MGGLNHDGFTPLRKDHPKQWVREKCVRSFPRWQHDATGLTVAGNRRPRFVSFSVSRMVHGLNLFAVSENDLSIFSAGEVLQLIEQVVHSPELGELVDIEIFANVPVGIGVLEKLEGRANSCFRKQDEHVADFGHYRRGSRKTLVAYSKSAELWKCQGMTVLQMREHGWGRVLRLELRLKGVGQVRRVLKAGRPAVVEGLCLASCYAQIRRNVLGYNLPELSCYFPESYTDFQSQDWRQKQC